MAIDFHPTHQTCCFPSAAFPSSPIFPLAYSSTSTDQYGLSPEIDRAGSFRCACTCVCMLLLEKKKSLWIARRMHFLLDLVPRCVVEVTRGSILIRGNESNDGMLEFRISFSILFSLRSVLRNRWQNSSYQPKLGLACVTQRTILPRFQSGGEGGEERETSIETSFFEQAIELWMIRREKRRKERVRERKRNRNLHLLALLFDGEDEGIPF